MQELDPLPLYPSGQDLISSANLCPFEYLQESEHTDTAQAHLHPEGNTQTEVSISQVAAATGPTSFPIFHPFLWIS